MEKIIKDMQETIGIYTRRSRNKKLDDDVRHMYSHLAGELTTWVVRMEQSKTASSLGSIKSKKKAQASRENGKKGGRPTQTK